jgi:hypothetical protein
MARDLGTVLANQDFVEQEVVLPESVFGRILSLGEDLRQKRGQLLGTPQNCLGVCSILFVTSVVFTRRILTLLLSDNAELGTQPAGRGRI